MSSAITHTNSYKKTAMNSLLSKQSMKDIQEMEMQEKFYGTYYATVAAKSTQFISGISRNAATLLATKVADCLLAYSKEQKHSTESSHHIETVLSDKEKAGMQYLGDYVLHNLHKKHGRTNSVESQQAMAILKAGKLESITDASQKLVSALNRGNLTVMCIPRVGILIILIVQLQRGEEK